ncbi:hypothetical protein VTL71DRAFT_10825 [Oculimacula yallundae]|uniref:Uncharacterized protein n=1 Tax=Oculimacula yallundae TaxID=86028 RepID=A0ABR4CUD1_9HELO
MSTSLPFRVRVSDGTSLRSVESVGSEESGGSEDESWVQVRIPIQKSVQVQPPIHSRIALTPDHQSEENVLQKQVLQQEDDNGGVEVATVNLRDPKDGRWFAWRGYK